jgi:hypothetical protein
MVTKFSQDPIINVIHKLMRKGINLTLENDCMASALILMLSAIDAMAYLSMPEGQEDVRAGDFIKWADQYIQFPGGEQLTGADLYGARCAMLHNFGARSRMSRNGECRVIFWMDRGVPPIKVRADLQPGYVLVSIPALKDALYAGMDRFLINLYKDPTSEQAKLADKRFETFVQETPTEEIMSIKETQA